MKTKLYFVPIYIGQLKYYEKLIPFLYDSYDVRFVFIRGDNERRQQMEKYCKENDYTFDIVEEGFDKNKGVFIPFVRSLRKHRQQSNALQKFLRKQKPSKLIFVRGAPKTQLAIKEANYLGIDTLVLQCAFNPPYNHYGKRGGKVSFINQTYHRVLALLQVTMDLFLRGPRYVFTSKEPRAIGAMKEEGRTILPEWHNYNPDNIHVVGNIESQYVVDLCKRTFKDQSYKKELLEKYELDISKQKVLVLSSWLAHYVVHKVYHTQKEEEEQIKYFDTIFKILREELGENIELLFKMHPSEKNIYGSYKKRGVKIYNDEAKTEELICLSDLCISDPATSANYMIIASGKQALFVNLSSVTQINRAASYYNISHVVVEKNDFIAKIKQFKKGSLPLQYEHDRINTKTSDSIVAFLSS